MWALSPLGFLDSLESSPQRALSIGALAIAGAFGLFSLIHIVLRILDSEYDLPPIGVLIGGLATGCVACFGAFAFSGWHQEMLVILVPPIIGAVHFAWLAINRSLYAT
jgi:4-hydroxybenzoate polyprenyltransferase